MDLPVIFDVILGIIVIYFISSVCLSFITGYIISRRNWKGEFLYDQLKYIFSSTSGSNAALVERIYKHPLIDSLKQYYYRKPEKIDPDLFAQTLTDVLRDLDTELLETKKMELEVRENATDENANPNELKRIREELEIMQNKLVFRSVFVNNDFVDGKGSVLLHALLRDKESYADARDVLRNWYENFVDRTQFLFSRKTKWWLFFYAFLFSLSLNIDTIKLYKTLTEDEYARTKLIAMAHEFSSVDQDSAQNIVLNRIKEQFPTDSLTENNRDSVHITIDIQQTVQLKNAMQAAYGDVNYLVWWKANPWTTFWDTYKNSPADAFYKLILKLLGVLISAFALMYGTPFWYDAMKKMITIRQSVNQK
jgi:hypothetical protein